MSTSASRQRLRGKTGCFSCRQRRKKCDERTPTCERCAFSGRLCEWPSSKQLVDRRYASHPKSRYGSENETSVVCLWSENTAHVKLTLDLEVIISRHFIEKYYGFLLLPNCHRSFHDGWIQDIRELMVTDESLRYSVLANAASHIHNMDTNPGMQSLSLQYYSKSISGLANALHKANDPYLAICNGLLMSVMLLYLHGCLGKGTYLDIPPHLCAAMRVLSLRFFDKPERMLQPFDHLALESVLYQMFLTSTVLWSDGAPLAEFDLQFWLNAELLLDVSVMFPDKPNSLNSPVLGVPVALFRLAVQAKQACQHPGSQSAIEMERLHDEIGGWEAIVLGQHSVDPSPNDNAFNRQQAYYDGATHLYVLVVSLLFEQAHRLLETGTAPEVQDMRFPEVVSQHTWQVQKALRILRNFEHDDDWASSYIGNWPVYTLGFFLDNTSDINLIKNEMDRRWKMTKFMQTPRFRDDLEAAWNARGLSPVALIDT